jgi:prepilin-type N-terminal cleavage/methylation domain-containing protein
VRNTQQGFSLAELMISMAIMLMIAGAATTALMKMTNAQATIWNRTQMHSGIRGATEVLQQEVGQAGRVAIPNTVALDTNVSAGSSQTVALRCQSPCDGTALKGMFVNERLVVDGSTTQEMVVITALNTSTNQITATFANPHSGGAAVRALGAFSSGVVPPTTTNGSSGTVLKLFGDINADGNMVYIEYTCDTTTTPGNLYRNSMAWDATAPSPAPAASQILLSNITANPDGSPCFTYQNLSVNIAGVNTYFVTDVAITLTVQTQLIDPVTKQFQTETKALLNVSPRNVFNAWTLAGMGLVYRDRIQPMPQQVLDLLP